MHFCNVQVLQANPCFSTSFRTPNPDFEELASCDGLLFELLDTGILMRMVPPAPVGFWQFPAGEDFAAQSDMTGRAGWEGGWNSAHVQKVLRNDTVTKSQESDYLE